MRSFRLPVCALVLVALTGCPPSNGPDLFRVAASGFPGSLLSVWGDNAQHAFVAGGFVGVDPAALSNGFVGRLVEYTPGTFTTRCTSDRVLWWTTGTRDMNGSLVVFAVGEDARVVRFAQGQCSTIAVDATDPRGAATFWGAYASSPDDVWLVGGSASPTGPRGVLVHYDGTHFVQEANLPSHGAQANLYKIDRTPDGTYFVVGSGGVVIARDPYSGRWADVSPQIATSDNRLFTVSCDRTMESCWAVGGEGSGIVLHGASGTWMQVMQIGVRPLDFLPGVNGVFVQDSQNVFVVGTLGFTMHTNGSVLYTPPTAPTMATLHGVGGGQGLVIAVGGELGVTTPDQRGVILIRGDDASTFTFDGQTYQATGSLRTSLGGAGQGG